MSDESEIIRILTKYGAGIDRRDWALFASCFTADFEGDYGGRVGRYSGREPFVAHWAESHLRFGATKHRCTNFLVDVDGDRAQSSCYLDAVLVLIDGKSCFNVIGVCEDAFRREADGWRMASRRFLMDLHRTIPL
jgi:hypothetical protein